MPALATPLVLLGGSFDPVHCGHLWMADRVYETLLEQGAKPALRFLPTAGSPFKGKPTSAKHRLAMLKRALRDTPYQIERIEIGLTPPTYTIDTLTKIRDLIGDKQPLVFVLGQDSFDSLARWKDGYGLLAQTHLWVFPRAGATTTQIQMPDELVSRQTTDAGTLLRQPHGQIFLASETPPDISSTGIREYFATTRSNNMLKKWLPARVFEYNQRISLYGKPNSHEY